ncbi:eukaryotic translation initiation factor 3 subunit I-like [Cynoglossus semilaevis]|uniref:eukaryotic translation initiation factor 3 subunit I-like n=1 Tax=Cynoglossus semilaevis TaxID=244447 RepID=UPI000D62DE40|nr:eukaryotic translation initiation factor 3 subunit I-like [Cynoglossus semilaevis]
MIALKPFNIYLQQCLPTQVANVWYWVPTTDTRELCGASTVTNTRVRFHQQHHQVFHGPAGGLSVFHELLRPEGSTTDREVLKEAKEHSRDINAIQTSVDLTMFTSASKDNTAKLFDSASLDHIKTFKTERPVNSLPPFLPSGGYGRWTGGHGSDHNLHQDWQI